MWIKKWLAARKLKRAAQVMAAAKPHKPERKLCEELLEHLSIPQFALYHSSSGADVFFTPHFKNIEEYTTILKEVTKAVRTERHILLERITPSETRLSVDRFLISNDGFYIDVEKAVGRFKEAALDFCKIMEPSDTEDSGFYEYNLRVLTKLFIDLRIIIGSLIEVSLHN